MAKNDEKPENGEKTPGGAMEAVKEPTQEQVNEAYARIYDACTTRVVFQGSLQQIEPQRQQMLLDLNTLKGAAVK